ncbi:MAG: hypothetical protein R2742_03900 [Micropruina glycogenica]
MAVIPSRAARFEVGDEPVDRAPGPFVVERLADDLVGQGGEPATDLGAQVLNGCALGLRSPGPATVGMRIDRDVQRASTGWPRHTGLFAAPLASSRAVASAGCAARAPQRPLSAPPRPFPMPPAINAVRSAWSLLEARHHGNPGHDHPDGDEQQDRSDELEAAPGQRQTRFRESSGRAQSTRASAMPMMASASTTAKPKPGGTHQGATRLGLTPCH